MHVTNVGNTYLTVPIEGFSLVASVSNKPPAVFSSASATYNQIQITNYCETSHATMKHEQDYTRLLLTCHAIMFKTPQKATRDEKKGINESRSVTFHNFETKTNQPPKRNSTPLMKSTNQIAPTKG